MNHWRDIYYLENDENKEIADKYKLIWLHKYLHFYSDIVIMWKYNKDSAHS